LELIRYNGPFGTGIIRGLSLKEGELESILDIIDIAFIKLISNTFKAYLHFDELAGRSAGIKI